MSRAVRFLQIIPTAARGGTEEYALTVGAAAARRGWDVTAALPRTGGTESIVKDYERLGARYRALNVAVPDAVPGNGKRLVLARFLRTARLLLRVRPDLVQVVLPWPTFGLGPLLACGLFQVPTVVVFQLTGDRHPFTGKTRAAYLWAKARGQTWVAVSDQNRRVLADGFGIGAGEIERVYNGVKPGVFERAADPAARADVRRELGLPPGATVLLSVGRLHEQKGFDLLPTVVPHVVREFPAAHFVVAGDGPDEAKLRAALRDRGVESNVHLIGRRTDVPRLLQAADVFLFPSRREGHPFALVEAMAAGVPVVASDASGIPELVTDREDGVLFRTGDACELLEAVRRALRHPADMRRLAEHARERAKQFTGERMLRETFDLFARLTGAAGAVESAAAIGARE